MDTSSIKNKIPKETDIAKYVFEKDESFDPAADTIVRVHIYKLRKKLEKYYDSTGRSDKMKLKIPKGHYHVDFIQVSLFKKKFSKYINQFGRMCMLVRNITMLMQIPGGWKPGFIPMDLAEKFRQS